MNTIAKREYLVVVVLVFILLASLIPSLIHARREHRDGIRRNEIHELKSDLELRNNELGYYPSDFDAFPHEFVVTKGDGQQATEWFLRAQLENSPKAAFGFDFEHNVYFRTDSAESGGYYDVCGGESTCGADRIQ